MTDAPDPTRVVADADVLAADLLVGGAARAALDLVRGHSWIDLVASDSLLEETEAVVAALADEATAAAHRDRLERDRIRVEHPPDDHPALASAHRGDAAHLLTFDERLRSVDAGLSVKPAVSVSVRAPDAFVTVFDAVALWSTRADEPYPGPDVDPRA